MPKTESEEELKSFLMRVKESERAGLRLNIKKKKKTRAWHPVPLLHGKYMKVVMISSSWAPKSQWTLTVAMKSEDNCFLAGKPRQCVENQRHYSADKGPISLFYVFA